MDGYSPKLQEVYPLAVWRQQTGYSDSHCIAVEVVQLSDRHSRADQALGQVELAKGTTLALSADGQRSAFRRVSHPFSIVTHLLRVQDDAFD